MSIISKETNIIASNSNFRKRRKLPLWLFPLSTFIYIQIVSIFIYVRTNSKNTVYANYNEIIWGLKSFNYNPTDKYILQWVDGDK